MKDALVDCITEGQCYWSFFLGHVGLGDINNTELGVIFGGIIFGTKK